MGTGDDESIEALKAEIADLKARLAACQGERQIAYDRGWVHGVQGYTGQLDDDLQVIRRAFEAARAELESQRNRYGAERDRARVERDDMQRRFDWLLSIIKSQYEATERQLENTKAIHEKTKGQIAEWEKDTGDQPFPVQLLLTAYNDVAGQYDAYHAKLLDGAPAPVRDKYLVKREFRFPDDVTLLLYEISRMKGAGIHYLICSALLSWAANYLDHRGALCWRAFTETRIKGAPMIRTLERLEATGWIDDNLKPRPKLETLALALAECWKRDKSRLTIEKYAERAGMSRELMARYERYWRAVRQAATIAEREVPELLPNIPE